MQSDLTYIVTMHLIALAVILTAGAMLTWGYVSEERWGRTAADRPGRPQKADGVLPQRPASEDDRVAA